jgi:hypothetical protein
MKQNSSNNFQKQQEQQPVNIKTVSDIFGSYFLTAFVNEIFSKRAAAKEPVKIDNVLHFFFTQQHFTTEYFQKQ